MSMFDPRRECLSHDELAQLQLERLQALLARLRRNVPRHRKTLGSFQVTSLEQLGDIPLMSPRDLAAAFPYGMFALPLREVIRLHSTIGPGGMQLVIGHTRNDLLNWARLAARQLVAAGASSQDVVQISFAGGAFGQALGHMLGAELIEASTIPQDAYHTEYQLAMMQNYRPSVLITTPTQAHELIRILEQRDIDPQSTQLRTVLLSRPVPDEERDRIKRGLFAEVRCGFGVPEVIDPGVSVECEKGRFHVNEDQFIAECMDGELVLTTLNREAMPLLRYQTRVGCELERIACACGRTGIVIRPGKRLDGRHRVNERPLYEAQVGALLNETRAARHPFLVDISEERVTIHLKLTSELFPDTVRHLVAVKEEIESAFLQKLDIRAEVAFMGPPEFENMLRERSAGASPCDGNPARQ